MAYKDIVLADSPVAYWRLGEASGTVAADSAGGGTHPGTIVGGVTLAQAGALAGDSDKSMLIDGSTGSITVAYAADLHTTTGPLSLEAWVYPSSVTGFGIVETTNSDAANTQWSFFVESSNACFRIVHVGGAQITLVGTAVSTGVWTHIAATWDGTTMLIYQNGLQTGSKLESGPSATGTSKTFLGVAASYTPYTLNGRLDEVAVYSSTLSAAKVLSHYQAGTYPFSTVTVAASSN